MLDLENADVLWHWLLTGMLTRPQSTRPMPRPEHSRPRPQAYIQGQARAKAISKFPRPRPQCSRPRPRLMYCYYYCILVITQQFWTPFMFVSLSVQYPVSITGTGNKVKRVTLFLHFMRLNIWKSKCKILKSDTVPLLFAVQEISFCSYIV